MPTAFCVPAGEFVDALPDGQNAALADAFADTKATVGAFFADTVAKIQKAGAEIRVPEQARRLLTARLNEVFGDTGAGQPELAVRSSGLDEDTEGSSLAGIHHRPGCPRRRGCHRRRRAVLAFVLRGPGCRRPHQGRRLRGRPPGAGTPAHRGPRGLPQLRRTGNRGTPAVRRRAPRRLRPGCGGRRPQRPQRQARPGPPAPAGSSGSTAADCTGRGAVPGCATRSPAAPTNAYWTSATPCAR
ncbi:hypothetical protein OG607_22250 [Streptomyces sp. NBC_01537]|uniref:hypothetical protein n=1 Tax=Streptomyces sp. NBC_01537 TaxID=2903896 RepID=UPI00386E5785